MKKTEKVLYNKIENNTVSKSKNGGSKMFTRQDYLSGKCSHSEYYSQYVTAQTKSIVSFYIPISKIKDAIEAGDTSLNTIPLGKWDALTFLFACNKAMHERGDYATLANKVCILKETAIVLYNEHVNGVS